MITLDGYDDALVAIATPCHRQDLRVAVYSIGKILEVLQERDGMDPDDARDFFEFNVRTAASNQGDAAPLFVEGAP